MGPHLASHLQGDFGHDRCDMWTAAVMVWDEEDRGCVVIDTVGYWHGESVEEGDAEGGFACNAGYGGVELFDLLA